MDMWIFNESFKLRQTIVEISQCFVMCSSNCRQTIVQNSEISYVFGIDIVCRFQGLPALCVCVAAACGASATSTKHALECRSMYLVDVCRLVSILVDTIFNYRFHFGLPGKFL